MPEQGAQPALEQKPQPPPSSMTEAGFSMNVKMLDEHGQEVMLTFRCPRASDSTKLIGHYNNTIKDLLQWGWQPLKAGARQAQDAPSNGGSAPKCRIHGSAMKESRKPGSYYCPRKLADGSFCKEQADAEQG